MAEYNIGDKFIVEIINKTDEPLAPYISGEVKNVTVYQLKGIPFMLDADTLSNFEKFEERKKGEWKTAYLDHEAFGVRPTVWYCSECHQITTFRTFFCPNCGADMRGETWTN